MIALIYITNKHNFIFLIIFRTRSGISHSPYRFQFMLTRKSKIFISWDTEIKIQRNFIFNTSLTLYCGVTCHVTCPVMDPPPPSHRPLSAASVWIFSLSEIEGFKEGNLWPEKRRKLINLFTNTNARPVSATNTPPAPCLCSYLKYQIEIN